MILAEAMSRIAHDLAVATPGYCLVGGLAIAVRVEPRFTRDLDFAIAVEDDEAAETLIRTLLGRGYALYATVEQARTGRPATARLWSPESSGRVAVDLLFASSGIEPEVCVGAEHIEVLPDVVTPVARAGHLVALKLLSVDGDRPRDAQDLVGLREVVTEEDIELARAAVALIVERQAHRGRDLVRHLDAWLARS